MKYKIISGGGVNPQEPKKILGKYTVIESTQNGILAEYTGKKFQITSISKSSIDDLEQSILSQKAQNLSDIHHRNISHLKLDEDDKCFYLIREQFQEVCEIDNSIFEKYNEELKYQKLLECYLQIFDAISHIHHKGFYHGNINPSNILIDKKNQVFLLDFGKSYFYESLKDKNQSIDERFYAPEQIADSANVGKASDIYAFGLCMIKIFLDSLGDENIKFEQKDLAHIFEEVLEHYELEPTENSLFVLIKQMTIESPQHRISLEKLGEELYAIHNALIPKNIYAKNRFTNINILKKELDERFKEAKLQNKRKEKPRVCRVQKEVCGYINS